MRPIDVEFIRFCMGDGTRAMGVPASECVRIFLGAGRDGGERARAILCDLVGEPTWDRVEALAAVMGDDHVRSVATTALEARIDTATGHRPPARGDRS